MLAAELARHYPTVTLSTDALEAARILADARLPGLIVLDDDGQPYTVLPGSQVLRFIVPRYVQEDPALARAYDEASADAMCDELAARTVRDVLPKRVDLFDLPVVRLGRHLHRDRRGDGGAAQPDRGGGGRFPVRRGGHGLGAAGAPARGRVCALTTWLVLAAFVAAYVLIATERIHRVAAALGGAAAMVLLGVVDANTAFFSEETGVDWNVIFLLLGMMIIVSVVKQTGVFEYLAIWSAKRARGRPFAVMVMLIVITALASALLDNVTTVLLVAPVTLLVCDRLGVSPIPFLIAEAMASNIGGTATLIGDPPNIIIASRSGLGFNDFLVNLAPLIIVLVGVFVAAVPVDVPVSVRLRREARRQGDAARRARGHQGQAPAGPVRRRAVPGDGRVHRPRRARHRPVAGRAAGRRRPGRGLADRSRASSSRRSSG